MFFKSQKKYIAYGGSRGGGKSWAMRIKFILLAVKYPGLKILLLRRTFAELEANHIIPLQAIFGKSIPYMVSKKVFTFPNGSMIKLGYCKNEGDIVQYQGHEYDVIGFEEATLFTEDQLVFISTCARNTRIDFTPRIYYTCNPGGVGHGYIKRLFIDKEYEGDENPDEYEFIPASVYDNEVLMKNDPSYIRVLDNLPEDLRKAHRDGDWDALSGQFFKEFRRGTHVVPEFEIPRDWDRYVTMDYGLDMLAAYWIAVDFEGNCYCYRELHEPDLIASEACAKILYMSKGENIKYFYVPPDLASRQKDTGKSALQIFHENGIIGVVTKNDRISGWLCVKEMLNNKGKDGKFKKPKLMITENCKNLIKYLPLIQRSDKNPKDISNEPHLYTHCADSIRYFCSTWLINPTTAEQGLSGTWYYGELRMKGYTDMQIKNMERTGQIIVIS